MAAKIAAGDEEGLQVVQVEGKGRGVVSTRPFSKGELICEYSGKHIPYEEAKRREEEYKGDPSVGCYMVYCVFKEKKFCVDATTVALAGCLTTARQWPMCLPSCWSWVGSLTSALWLPGIFSLEKSFSMTMESGARRSLSPIPG